MPFEPKDWKDEEGPKGLVDAAELIALEARLAEYTDAEAGRATTAEGLKLTKTANLADLDDAAEARDSLGLGTAATEDSGAVGEAGMVLAADDPGLLEALVAKGLSKGEVEAVALELGLNVFNVKHYGAKGDSATDDHAAIQAAIDAAGAAAESGYGGGIVYFPPAVKGKQYKTTSNFKFKFSQNVHFLGCYEASTIHLTADLQYGECIFERTTPTESGGNIAHRFENIFVRGPETWPGSPISAKVSGYPPCLASGFEVGSQTHMYRCHAENLYAGFWMREFSQVFEDCRTDTCFYGRYCGPSAGTTPFQKGGFQAYRHEDFPVWAKIGIHPSYNTEGTTLMDEGGSNEPYYFYKEGPQGVTGSFLEAVKGIGITSQATGNAVIYDENQAASMPASYFKEASAVRLTATGLNVKMNVETRLGNTQLLAITATGGTYKIVIPASIGLNGGAGFAGGTTAALNWNATNAEVKTKIEAVVGSGSSVYVSTVEGKKQILINGKAALLETKKMTLEVGSLTGGTATLTEPAVDPNMGPRTRPTAAKIVEVKNATGGTYKLKVKVGAAEATTAAIKWNASVQEFHEALAALSNVSADGVVTGNVSAVSKYYLFFNGRSLNQTVEITPEIGSLVGAGAEVKVETGEAASLANRHSEYPIDCGILNLKVDEGAFAWEFGTVGGIRAATIARLKLEGKAGELFISSGKENEMLPVTASKVEHAELRGKGAAYRMFNVTGPVAVGDLLATNGTGLQAIIYPKTETRPAAGFSVNAVPEGKTRWVPVAIEQPGGNSTGAGVVSANYDAVGTPAANKFLKPSTETAGKVTTGGATEYVVGVTLATGSAGTVKTSPRGAH